GAPGCSWSVSLDYLFPLAVQSIASIGVASSPTFAVPNVASLGGQSFYEQACFFDRTANALGVVPVGATRWRIGTGRTLPGSMVHVGGRNAAVATQGISDAVVTTLKLN